MTDKAFIASQGKTNQINLMLFWYGNAISIDSIHAKPAAHLLQN